MKKIVISLLLITFVSGCQSSRGYNQQSQSSGFGTGEILGTLLGAAGGGLLGSQFGKGNARLAYTAGGTFLGAILGNAIGSRLDKVDQYENQRAYETAQRVPVGTQVAWNNQNTGNYGYVTPTRDGYNQYNEYCREFNQVIVIDGRQQQAYGVACRQQDGTWKIQ